MSHHIPHFFKFNMFFSEELDFVECFHFYYIHNFCAYVARGFLDDFYFFSFRTNFIIDFASAYYRNTFIYLHPRIEIKVIQKILDFSSIYERLFSTLYFNIGDFAQKIFDALLT